MMLKSKDYVLCAVFGVVCGLAAFFIMDQKYPIESLVVGAFGAGGYLYGKYRKEKEQHAKTKISKKAAKRAQRGK
jgi:hypothetical protein